MDTRDALAADAPTPIQIASASAAIPTDTARESERVGSCPSPERAVPMCSS